MLKERVRGAGCRGGREEEREVERGRKGRGFVMYGEGDNLIS